MNQDPFLKTPASRGTDTGRKGSPRNLGGWCTAGGQPGFPGTFPVLTPEVLCPGIPLRPGETGTTGLLGAQVYLSAAKYTKDLFRRERLRFKRTMKTQPTGTGLCGPPSTFLPFPRSRQFLRVSARPPRIEGIRGRVQGQVVSEHRACFPQGKRDDRSQQGDAGMWVWAAGWRPPAPGEE